MIYPRLVKTPIVMEAIFCGRTIFILSLFTESQLLKIQENLKEPPHYYVF